MENELTARHVAGDGGLHFEAFKILPPGRGFAAIHLDVGSGEERPDPRHLPARDPRLDDPEPDILHEIRRGPLIHLHRQHDMLEILGETDGFHLADIGCSYI